MIEATIKKIYGERKTTTNALTGVRCGLIELSKRTYPPQTYAIKIGGIIRVKKGQRIRREMYTDFRLGVVELEDIVVDEYEED